MSQWREQFGFWGSCSCEAGSPGWVHSPGGPGPRPDLPHCWPRAEGSPGYLWAWVDTVVLSLDHFHLEGPLGLSIPVANWGQWVSLLESWGFGAVTKGWLRSRIPRDNVGQTGKRLAWQAPLLPALLRGARPGAVWGWEPAVYRRSQDLGLGGAGISGQASSCREGQKSALGPGRPLSAALGELTWPHSPGTHGYSVGVCRAPWGHFLILESCSVLPLTPLGPWVSPLDPSPGWSHAQHPMVEAGSAQPHGPWAGCPSVDLARDGGRRAARGQKA